MKENLASLPANDLVTTLRRYKVDFILLAGFSKLIRVELVQAYPRSILNFHPSLLPAYDGEGYYGMKVHQAVIASGARYVLFCFLFSALLPFKLVKKTCNVDICILVVAIPLASWFIMFDWQHLFFTIRTVLSFAKPG